MAGSADVRAARLYRWLALIAAVSVVLWLVWLQGRSWPFASAASVLRSLAAIAGDVGLALLAYTLVMGLRWSAVERLFDGLARAQRVHHAAGVFAYLLLLAHPLLLAGSGLTSSVQLAGGILFSPMGRPTLFFLGWLSLGLLALTVVTSFVPALPHRLWRGLHVLGWPVFFAGWGHGVAARGRVRAVDAVLVALAVGAFAVRLTGLRRSARLDYLVSDIHHLGPDVVEFELTPAQPGLRLDQGQFVYARFYDPRIPWQCTEYHPFTVASGSAEAKLRVVVKAVGDCTRVLATLRPGARAHLRGPFGRLVADTGAARQIWLAGGVGVAPFLSALRSQAQVGCCAGAEARSSTAPPARGDIDIYYCANRDEEAHYLEELRALARRIGRVRVVPVIASRDGFLSAERIERDSGQLKRATFSIAGPREFVDALRSDLRAHGVVGSQIHDERFP
jgi:predicted ferric reductase